MNVFSKWSVMLSQHAEAYNTLWGKLRSGTFEVRDWFTTLGSLIETTAAAMQFSVESFIGPTAPPWVTVRWTLPGEPPPREKLIVRAKLPVDRFHSLHVTDLASLGAATQSKFKGKARVDLDSGNSIEIQLKPSPKDPTPGEYIGFIFSNQYSDPLAIVTVVVPDPNKDDTGAETNASAPEPPPVKKARAPRSASAAAKKKKAKAKRT